jgi:hypothetical protein
MTQRASPLSCPSAQPDMEDARIFGLVGGSVDKPEIAYLKRDALVGPDVIEQLGDLDPTHVFRFSAKCESSRCAQFENGKCGLGIRVAKQLPAVVTTLPSCQIRDSCRWFAESGSEVCYRCPQVMTRVPETQNALRAAAQPEV